MFHYSFLTIKNAFLVGKNHTHTKKLNTSALKILSQQIQETESKSPNLPSIIPLPKKLMFSPIKHPLVLIEKNRH